MARADTLIEGFPPPPFEGFPDEGLRFFRELAEHQDKTWFGANKPVYERAVQTPLGSLVVELSARLAKLNIPLRGDPKRSLFRINRDVRFSNNKQPYKTHASAVLTRTGEKSAAGLLYIHIDPAGSFAAAGFFRPDPPVLQRMRTALAAHPSAWTKMEAGLAKQGFHLDTGDALIRPPKGFDDAGPSIQAALKLKTWIVRRPLVPAEIADAALIDTLAGFAQAAKPLLEFGWAALDG